MLAYVPCPDCRHLVEPACLPCMAALTRVTFRRMLLNVDALECLGNRGIAGEFESSVCRFTDDARRVLRDLGKKFPSTLDTGRSP